MRLWSQQLIPYLPDKQLGGQWVEIRMILGSIEKHGKVNHSTVNYVNDYPLLNLYAYGYLVYLERKKRGMYSNPIFISSYSTAFDLWNINNSYDIHRKYSDIIYSCHDDSYMEECLLNLEGKGIYLRDKINIDNS